MAEKRKPSFTILLRKRGKKKANKIEVYPAALWGEWSERYRLRVNGKWFKGRKFVTHTEIKELVFRSIKLK